MNIEDAILFLDQYKWNLDVNKIILFIFLLKILFQNITNDYFNGIQLKQKPDHNPSEMKLFFFFPGY